MKEISNTKAISTQDGTKIKIYNSPSYTLEKDLLHFLEHHVTSLDKDWERIKEEISNIPDVRNVDILKRKTSPFLVKFQQENTNFSQLKKKAEYLRSLWELQLDNETNIEEASIAIGNNSQKALYSVLFKNQKAYRIRSGRCKMYPELKINFGKLHSSSENLDSLGKAFNKWFEIKNNYQTWGLISNALNQYMDDDSFGDPSKYLSIIMAIQAFDAIKNNTHNLNWNSYINHYASISWKENISNLLNCDANKLGTYFKEIRNVLAHPNKKAKEKNNGRYWEIVSNGFLLQKAYAYLGGLLVKSILLHLYDISEKDVESHVSDMISYRASWTPIEYDE